MKKIKIKMWWQNKSTVLIIGFMAIFVFSQLVETEATQFSNYQFKITYVGKQSKAVKTIGFAPGSFNVSLFTPYRTPGIHYGNDEIELMIFSINTDEASRLVSSSQPYMFVENDPYISFMIWNGSKVTEALLDRTNSTNLLNKLINALDTNDTEGRAKITNMLNAISYCLGDIDGNKVVGLSDLVTLAKAYGKKCGDIGYDDRADLNGDCSVSLADLVILSKQYGKSC